MMMVTINIYFGSVPGIGLIMLIASFIHYLSFGKCFLSTYCASGMF